MNQSARNVLTAELEGARKRLESAQKNQADWVEAALKNSSVLGELETYVRDLEEALAEDKVPA